MPVQAAMEVLVAEALMVVPLVEETHTAEVLEVVENMVLNSSLAAADTVAQEPVVLVDTVAQEPVVQVDTVAQEPVVPVDTVAQELVVPVDTEAQELVVPVDTVAQELVVPVDTVAQVPALDMVVANKLLDTVENRVLLVMVLNNIPVAMMIVQSFL